ncbi:MAG: prolyl oligopeptidase family serine peptidase [Meiothermus sp.]|nr:prolyl oligopeptidase family serine peptidase [Meiothermus sp.]
MHFRYPISHPSDCTDELHGLNVADPYRWLEDPNSEATRRWVEEQNQLTFGYLEQLPARHRLLERLTALWNFPKLGGFFKRGGRYFSYRNSGLQNQSVLCVQDSLDSEARVLLDPNTLSEDGTVALGSSAVSRDGRWLAYSLSSSGSDWQTWRVRSVDTQEDLPDELRWSKFSGAAWLPDGSGFFYSRYDVPTEGHNHTQANRFQKVYLHRLNTPQAQDRLVYERPDQPEWGFGTEVSHDGRYLLLNVWKGTYPENLFFYRELGSDGPFIELIPEFKHSFWFLGNEGSRFFFQTNWNAPRKQIIALDVVNPDPQYWQTLVAERSDVLLSAQRAFDGFACEYLHHAHTQLMLFDLEGGQRGEVALPTLGTAYASGEEGDPELFFSFESFLHPPSAYVFDFNSGKTRVLHAPQMAFDADPFETRQVFVPGKDGTRVPLFLTHRKGLERGAGNPTLLYGYGGFNVSETPRFSVSRLVWLEQGGVYAHAVLRGGGEYGEAWWRAGILDRKQNVFDDFAACAEWLIDQRYTRPERLAIQGGSNGGLLVGACMTQRPELFGVALPAVGVMDMLRFHKFTIGWAWTSDYGSPEDPEAFRHLLAYSPLHNLKPGTSYPATLVTTADHDDRVVPAHSFKFAAALQAAHAGERPVLIRVQTKAGHGAGMPTKMKIEELADIYAFTLDQMGLG